MPKGLVTRGERKAVREGLFDAGFRRESYTPVDAMGGYTETWHHDDGATLTIAWSHASIPDEALTASTSSEPSTIQG